MEVVEAVVMVVATEVVVDEEGIELVGMDEDGIELNVVVDCIDVEVEPVIVVSISAVVTLVVDDVSDGGGAVEPVDETESVVVLEGDSVDRRLERRAAAVVARAAAPSSERVSGSLSGGTVGTEPSPPQRALADDLPPEPSSISEDGAAGGSPAPPSVI